MINNLKKKIKMFKHVEQIIAGSIVGFGIVGAFGMIESIPSIIIVSIIGILLSAVGLIVVRHSIYILKIKLKKLRKEMFIQEPLHSNFNM